MVVFTAVRFDLDWSCFSEFGEKICSGDGFCCGCGTISGISGPSLAGVLYSLEGTDQHPKKAKKYQGIKVAKAKHRKSHRY